MGGEGSCPTGAKRPLLGNKASQGHPHKYDQMEIFKDIVAKEINVLKINAPNKDGKGWKRTYSEINTQEDLGTTGRRRCRKVLSMLWKNLG